MKRLLPGLFMTTSRFYRPVMASFVPKEKIFMGLAEDAGLNYFMPSEMTTRRVVTSKGIPGGVQVTYSFSSAVRDEVFAKRDSNGIGKYGVHGISFRLLYDFLCEQFNSGVYFIDTYFDSIFDTRPEYEELSQLNDNIIEDIEEERIDLLANSVYRVNGELDMRYAVNKRYVSLETWKNPVRKAECARVAHDIQDDIVLCLANGRIPLTKQAVATSTVKTRERLVGLFGDRMFYASGQLIKHLKIYVELSEA
jgi:hypothetical protein